jgi:adenylate cyclase
VVVSDAKASRQHCLIERRQDHFVLKDHSSNGTFVSVEGEPKESILRREEFTLRGHGWIAFGQPRASAEEVLEYWCE